MMQGNLYLDQTRFTLDTHRHVYIHVSIYTVLVMFSIKLENLAWRDRKNKAGADGSERVKKNKKYTTSIKDTAARFARATNPALRYAGSVVGVEKVRGRREKRRCHQPHIMVYTCIYIYIHLYVSAAAAEKIERVNRRDGQKPSGLSLSL